MARRRQTIGGDDEGDIVDAYTQAYFKRGQQEDPRLATAMQLLGLQMKQQQYGQERELEAQKQKAEEMWRSGQLGMEREKLGVTSKEAAEAEKARQETRKFQEEATKRDIEYKTKQGEREAEKAGREATEKAKTDKATAIWRLANEGVLSKEEAKAQLDQLYPENLEVAKGLKEQKISEGVAANLERFKNMTPEQRKAYAQNPVEVAKLGGVEGYQRMMSQFPSDANLPPEAPQQGFWSKLFFPQGVSAREIPTTGALPRNLPAEEYPSGITPQNIANVPTPQAQAQAQTPIQMPETVGYGQDVGGPEWRYGTGTQAIPQAPIAVPQVQRSLILDDILRKAMQGDEAQAQEMPWLYGGRGWPTSQPIPGPTPLPRELIQ